jgi:predicted ribosome quality control (RQC) complex YloA/Tae2 family protein
VTGARSDDPGEARTDPPGNGGFRSYRIDGFEVLVGKGARDNERLSLRVARQTDLWLHAAGHAGSHVVVRSIEGVTDQVPPAVVQFAAECAVWFSKARGAGGKVNVHMCRAKDVSKARGAPTGQVTIRDHETVRVYSREPS